MRRCDVTKELGIVLDTDPSQVSDKGSFQPSLFSESEPNQEQEVDSEPEELN